MHLHVSGHPLHTRALSVTLMQRDDGRLDLAASILDLRKRGFVPVAADLQPSGVIHHMHLGGIVDAGSGRLDAIEAAQPAVAFEPSAMSRGESCRDPIARLQALRGATVGAGFARRLSAEIGGPRGCSHVLTLGQLVGSSVAWALRRERELHESPPARRAGERVFRRDVILDGHEASAQRLEVAIQLTDLHFAPTDPVARPMERFAAELETRLLATIRSGTFLVERIDGAERARTLEDLETAGWTERNATLEPLAGLPVLAGFIGELLRRLGDAADDSPLLDALLMLPPALIQIIAALSEDWPARSKNEASLMGTGGMPDSCYMWRRDGALSQALRSEIKAGTVKPPHRRS